MKKHSRKIIAAAAVVIVLAAAFFWGGNIPKQTAVPEIGSERNAREVPEEYEISEENTEDESGEEQPEASEEEKNEEEASPENFEKQPQEAPSGKENDLPLSEKDDGLPLADDKGEEKPLIPDEKDEAHLQSSTETGEYSAVPLPEEHPLPIEPNDAEISDKELTCTLSVRCDTIFSNLYLFDPEKTELLPEDGVIFAAREVTFYEGESVFNLLLREMRKNKIHMEFSSTPIFNSAYIEGIANIYEFDCGELSGWMYRVNGWFPNYGCSRYELRDGDVVEWVYTCDLGSDVGDGYSPKNAEQ